MVTTLQVNTGTPPAPTGGSHALLETLTPMLTSWSSLFCGNATMNFDPARSSESLRGRNLATTLMESSFPLSGASPDILAAQGRMCSTQLSARGVFRHYIVQSAVFGWFPVTLLGSRPARRYSLAGPQRRSSVIQWLAGRPLGLSRGFTVKYLATH